MVGLLAEYNTNAHCVEEIGKGLPYGACKSPIPSGVIAKHAEKTMKKPTTKAVALLSLPSFANDSDSDNDGMMSVTHHLMNADNNDLKNSNKSSIKIYQF